MEDLVYRGQSPGLARLKQVSAERILVRRERTGPEAEHLARRRVGLSAVDHGPFLGGPNTPIAPGSASGGPGRSPSGETSAYRRRTHLMEQRGLLLVAAVAGGPGSSKGDSSAARCP